MTEEHTIKLGEHVWVAVARGQRKKITCPDCFGTGQLDVTLRDGTHHSIDCRGCEQGYLGPQGTVETWEYEPSVELHTITKIEQDIGQPPEYRAGHFCYKADQVFLTRDGAEARAAVLAKEQADEEDARIKRKEKDTKTWAWNVHYHRKGIRDAEKSIAYHTSKLNVAKLHVKTEKENENV
jgi:hypothetical protein